MQRKVISSPAPNPFTVKCHLLSVLYSRQLTQPLADGCESPVGCKVTDSSVTHVCYYSGLDVDPCMFEGSRPYGPGTVQTGKEFKGLRIINSLKRGKEIIFTALGAQQVQSPCGSRAMTTQPRVGSVPSK